MATQSYFYVTLLSNASRDIYEQNKHSDFTVKFAHPVDLVSTSNWVDGPCEISCSSRPMEEETLAIIYCNFISPQFVGDSTVRSMRILFFASSTKSQHENRKVHYVPVEQRGFQEMRIEFPTTEVLHIPLEDSTKPKVVLLFSKNLKCGRKKLYIKNEASESSIGH